MSTEKLEPPLVTIHASDSIIPLFLVPLFILICLQVVFLLGHIPPPPTFCLNVGAGGHATVAQGPIVVRKVLPPVTRSIFCGS
jgi:hypothetical protein